MGTNATTLPRSTRGKNAPLAYLRTMRVLADRLSAQTNILPLVVFRVAFGLLMFISAVRFWANGWINDFYIAPVMHFPHFGFEWLTPLPDVGMYLVFAAMAVLALCIAAGLFYRAAMIGFFILFSYVELLDRAFYLNHYYFISLLSFLLIFLPLNRRLSLDVWRRPELRADTVPAWTIDAIRLQLAIVYFFAGLAKLNPDWLFRAMPLSIWLPARTSTPIIGALFDYGWFAYLMSWAGAVYDLTIPFWLMWRKTRPFAYIAVIGFHVITAALFNIGMFPWIMIVSSLIFLDARDYAAIEKAIRRFVPRGMVQSPAKTPPKPSHPRRSWHLPILIPFFAFQVLMPMRHVLYPGDVLWTEEGFRFSWRVMLVEKAGVAIFWVHDPESGLRWAVYPGQFLTDTQEKQMSFQPDMILQFAHFLDDHYRAQGYADVEVYAEVYVTFNGRGSRLLIDPNVDLSAQPITLWHKTWILE